MSNSPQRQRTILGADGELQEIVAVPEPSHTALFCTQCGVANKDTSRYCRQCGQSLDDQTFDGSTNYADYVGLGRRKSKLALPTARPTQAPLMIGVGAAIMEILTLLAVVGMVSVVAFQPRAQDIIPFILLAWVLVEGVRFRRR